MTTFDREASGRRLRLTPSKCALLVIDVQTRLAAAIPEGVMASVEKNIRILLETAHQLDIPVFVSEQYPKGLGKTVTGVEQALGHIKTLHRWEKVEFSAVANDAFAGLQIPRIEARPDIDQWIVCGMETHVCVYQTVRDITGWGSTVHLVGDAVASRTKANYRCGLELSRDAGALITSTETVVFDLLGKAATPQFKALSQAVK